MNSNSKIIQSLFKVNNAVTVIGFTAFGGSIVCDRSILEMSNILDYIYNFRIENTSLKFNSSVIKNDNCFNSINFSLKNSSYEGANNSIFTLDNQGRAFNFWITDSAQLITVNSVYYFKNTNKNNAFIYFNNNNYDLLKPVWFSNIISADTILLENLDKKDGNSMLLDFNEKNIYFNFTDEFDFTKNDFFIPVKDSPLLQTGITEYNSPIQIPKYDFKGNLRTVSGYGIDIGAVQISGN
jgi:hypothetical protein